MSVKRNHLRWHGRLKKGKVLCFGELLLRLCTDSTGNWLEQNATEVYLGGAEANVATNLALWNIPSIYMGALPDTSLSHQIVSYLEKRKVEMLIQYQGKRVGVYYLTKGMDIKNNGVVYDRNNSSFSTLQPGTIDWEKVLKDVSWLHVSAITPALSSSLAAVTLEALEKARQNGIFISIDLNYREKLWQYGKLPHEVMPQLVGYCDLIMGNLWAADTMLGIPSLRYLISKKSKEEMIQNALQASNEIMKSYPNCKIVTNTFRLDQEADINYFATLFDGFEFYCSKEYHTKEVVNKVGSGDSFMSGLIYGFYNDWPVEETLEFATSAAFSKLFTKSDSIDKTVEEILANASYIC